MAHAHIHILGSRAGYTTLDATPGVTTAERAELEVLSFGDATNAEAMARLETHASMIGRRLRSGRFAISRMLPGGTDDAGRPTIEVVSLLVDLASYTAILGALARLASDARLWRVARGAVSRGFEVPEEPVQITASDPRVLRAFDAWIAARKQGATAVLGAGDEPGLFAMVALLDTDDLAACRWGVGVLSLSAPVDVCTLAPTTAAIGPRPVLRASTAHAQPWLNPEMAAAEEHAARNPLLPPSASLAQAVRIEPAFDRPARATPAWDAEPVGHDPQPRRKSLLPIAAVSAACSLALLAVMAVAYARGGVRDADSRPTAEEPSEVPLVVESSAAEATVGSVTDAYAGIAPIAPPEPSPATPTPLPEPAPPIADGVSSTGAVATVATGNTAAPPTSTPHGGDEAQSASPSASEAPSPSSPPESKPPDTLEATDGTSKSANTSDLETFDKMISKFSSANYARLFPAKPEKNFDRSAVVRARAREMASDFVSVLLCDQRRKQFADGVRLSYLQDKSGPSIAWEFVADANGFILTLAVMPELQLKKHGYRPLSQSWTKLLESIKNELTGIPVGDRHAWNEGIESFQPEGKSITPSDRRYLSSAIADFLQFSRNFELKKAIDTELNAQTQAEATRAKASS